MEPKDLTGLTPEDCAVIVYNYQMEEIDKVLKENERRIIPYLDQPVELPQIDAKRLFKALEEMINRAFVTRQDITEGNIEQWQERGRLQLLRDLSMYAYRTDNEDLLRQLGEIDPCYKPLPPLTEKQLAELESLQNELNTLQNTLCETIEISLYNMRKITIREGEIVNGTEQYTARKMLSQVENFLCGLTEFIGMWRSVALKSKDMEVEVKSFL